MQAVLWDNDGVLLDSETVFYAVTKRAFSRLGLELTREVWGSRYLGLGTPSRDIARSLGARDADIAPVLDERNKEYLSVLKEPPPVRPRVAETLSALTGRVKLALVTGCHLKPLHLMHARSGLLKHFETIVTGDDCDSSKPNPEPYLTAMAAMGLDSKHCIAIEDSRRGLESALNAGVACMVVPTDLTKGHDFTGALSVEPDVSGILKYLSPDVTADERC